ncbi:MAG: transglutaminase domain-containing protein [Ilumatobacteraceae bacterium]|nr:transglutaminase domain-containing protein [Ilumatobacteraceae bacterium]
MDVTRLRLVLTTALGVLLALVASNAFDSTQWPLLLPVGIAAVGAVLVVNRRLVLRLAVGTVAVVGGVFAATLAADGAPSAAWNALVEGPRQLLTTEWPSPAVPSVVGAVALLVGVTVAIALDLAGRARWHLAPLGVIAIGWVAALSIGAPVRPPIWVFALGGVCAVVFALTRHDRGVAGASGVLAADRTIAMSVVAIAAVTLGTASAVAWADRADPRRTADAETNAAVLDPIEAMVALRRADPPFPLFSIVDRSRVVGQSFPARWRIAALDTYDGQRWVPRVTLRPIGGRLGLPTPPSVERPPAVDYELTYESDDIALLPYPGAPLSASVDVETDLGRVVVRPLEAPQVDDVVMMSSEVAPTSRSALDGTVGRRPVDDIAEGFGDRARALVDEDTTVIEQLRQIEATMRDEWQLDPSAPGGGQQLALIDRFLGETTRGTREQFVTAFVLLARSLGVDARVATGFIVPPESIGPSLVLESSMASVWPEVRFENVGWVPFDPVPQVVSPDDGDPEPPPEAQTPAAAQPPIAPPNEDVEPTDEEVPEVVTATDRWDGVRRWLQRGAVVSAIGLLPILLAVGLIVGIKWRRRRRRRRAPDPVARIRGVWANATDALVDAGMTIGPSWTDDTIASSAASLAPSVPHELRRLAAMSTQVTFGAAHGADALADDAVLTSAAVDQAVRDERTRWQRVRWRLSLRSLRRSTRSPVSPD